LLVRLERILANGAVQKKKLRRAEKEEQDGHPLASMPVSFCSQIPGDGKN
jgi:hypothetical protein